RERERRKTLLAVRGASSVTEYEGAGGETLPRLLDLLDGYAGFRSTFEDVDLGAPLDLFRSLVGEGRPLGMAFAITADRAGAGFVDQACAPGPHLRAGDRLDRCRAASSPRASSSAPRRAPTRSKVATSTATGGSGSGRTELRAWSDRVTRATSTTASART